MFGIPNLVPWEGPAYAGGANRIMVIGETHYGKWTEKQIVEHLLLPTTGSGTWTGFVKAVTNDPALTRQSRANFLNCIVFYNYIVNFQPETAEKSQVSDAQRSDPDNQRILLEMVKAYRPTHMIVWGLPNFRSIAQGDLWTRLVMAENGAAYSALKVGDIDATAIGIKHPAIGFSSSKWGPVLAAFLHDQYRPLASVQRAPASSQSMPAARSDLNRKGGQTWLLRLEPATGQRAWVTKRFERNNGIPLLDRAGNPIYGRATAETRKRVLEGLNVLFHNRQLDGVGGFSYHGIHRVAVVTDTGVELDWP